MGFVKLNCPNCGAEMNLDSSREFGFCQYCGTKVVQDRIVVEHRGSVGIDRTDEVNNLLLRADEFFNKKDFETSKLYYNKVLDIEATNPLARGRISEIDRILATPNFILQRISSNSFINNTAITVIIDNAKVIQLYVGDKLEYKLSLGKHTIKVYAYNEKQLKNAPKSGIGKPKEYTYYVDIKEYPEQSKLILQLNWGRKIKRIFENSPKLNSPKINSRSNGGFVIKLLILIIAIFFFMFILLGIAVGISDPAAFQEAIKEGMTQQNQSFIQNMLI